MNQLSSANTNINQTTPNNHYTIIMKANKYIAGFLALFAVQSASALTFEITGATAFRRATIESVFKLYDLATGNPVFRYVANNATYYNSDFITFEGTVDGLPGTTIIRCSFNGSIEGLRALAQPGTSGATSNGNAYYFKTSALSATAVAAGAGTVISASVASPSATPELERAEAEMAFSDTDVAISPYFAAAMTGSSPGAVVFAVCSSDGSGITNVTAQQYNSLLTSGYIKKSFFTGNPLDTALVFIIGRNDGSGTRSSYLAEMGYGVANPVNQYLVISRTSTNTSTGVTTAIQAVPAGGVNDTDPVTAGVQLPADLQAWVTAGNTVTQGTANASVVWGQDQNGNGGASSGSALTLTLAQTGPSVRVFDGNGANLFGGTPQTNISTVTWISVNDAITARTGGANLCSFNGVALDLTGNVMTSADQAKVTNGAYSAWNFQQFYYKDGASTETVDLYNSLFTLIESGSLGVAGIKNSSFNIGRSEDGGVINPFE